MVEQPYYDFLEIQILHTACDWNSKSPRLHVYICNQVGAQYNQASNWTTSEANDPDPRKGSISPNVLKK